MADQTKGKEKSPSKIKSMDNKFDYTSNSNITSSNALGAALDGMGLVGYLAK